MDRRKNFLGEFTGTFLMVLFGCGAVIVSTVFNQYDGILPIAIVWGGAVTLGIFLTRSLCEAHFNPAVSVGMALIGKLPASSLPVYLSAQFSGAFAAGLTLYGLFGGNIRAYEQENGISRGTVNSMYSAKMFGEYYALPGAAQKASMPVAMAAEFAGTFILFFAIVALTDERNRKAPGSLAAPVLIGFTLTSCIALLAPLTQAGFNPARDFAPRLVALLFGWGSAAFPDTSGGFFWVYMFSPVIGAAVAGLLYEHAFCPADEKVRQSKTSGEICMQPVISGGVKSSTMS